MYSSSRVVSMGEKRGRVREKSRRILIKERLVLEKRQCRILYSKLYL